MQTVDLTGRNFNFLDVISFDHIDYSNRSRVWKCRCRCGNIIYATTYHLTTKNKKHRTRSCSECRPFVITRNRNLIAGVTKNINTFRAQIHRKNKNYELGSFPSKDEAYLVYKIAESFVNMKSFEVWHKNRKELLAKFYDICDKYNVDKNIIEQAIFDGCYSDLYLEPEKLDEFVQGFVKAYKDTNELEPISDGN